MKISKEEIEQAAFNHAIITNGSDDVDSYRHAGSAVDFIAGADWMYQQLEPLITELSMDKARRQSEGMTLEQMAADRASMSYRIGSQDWIYAKNENLRTLQWAESQFRTKADQLESALKQCQSDRDEAAQKIGKWIPVSERLPTEEGEYLICDMNYQPPLIYSSFCQIHEGTTNFYSDTGERDPDRVTHWMPLPSAPQALQSTEPNTKE